MAKKATTNNAQLEELNALRRQLQMVPLNKAPEGDLSERIAKLKQRVERDPVAQANAKAASDAAPAEETTTPEETPAKVIKKGKVPDVKKAPKTVKGTKVKVEPENDASTVRLGDICKRLELDARLARIKLRKAGDKVPDTVGDSWRWAAKDVSAVEAIINATKGGDAT